MMEKINFRYSMKNIGIPQNKTLITVDRKDGSGLLKE